MATTTTSRTTTNTATTLAPPQFATSQPAPASPPLPRSYKDFLTPLLHRRFTNAAALLLCFCWLAASYLSTSDSWLWSWFPISLTGIRALLLSIPCLAIFIVRVMNMEVGGRTTTSGIETFVQRATEARTWMTLFWYVFSGWFFGEVYIWSSSEDAELGWIDYGRAYERPRANENPIMLRSMILLFSIAKALQHLSSDRDDIKIHEAEKMGLAGALDQGSRTSWLPESVLLLRSQARSMAARVISWTLVGCVFAMIGYLLFLRNVAWRIAYPVACIMVRSLPSNADPSGILYASVFARQAISSCGLLVMLWELSNVIFTIHVSQLPLKRGEPLTNEVKDPAGKVLSKSADPNGSLIRGFKAKATVTRGFAFWELFLITTHFQTRRTTIFSEVERKPQSTWAQTSALCLAELNAIGERIKNANAPTDYQKKTAESEQQRKQQEYLIAQKREKNLSLPKIAQRGVLDEREVLAKHTGNPVSTAIKSFGQSPGASNPVSPRARKALEWTEQHTGFNRSQLSVSGLQREANGYSLHFLRTPLGEPFRQNFSRRVQAVIYGVPFSSKANIFHAAKSLVSLAVSSLKEDDFGQVAPSIPLIIRTFTSTITAVQKHVQTLEPHWTDVYFTPADRNIPEVTELVDLLRKGLEEVLLAFGEYATSLGLEAKELREAREAIGRKDMVERRV
ncbi:hypothetical protein KC345_g8602 [Hortaea werneckii]|nr:hypothetical protein KC345_g8602 [Hortaea werneckii]